MLKKTAAAILSRSPIILGVATILLLLAVGTRIKGNSVDAWRMLHIPAMTYAFADTHTVTDSIDCVMNGTDPFVVPKCQPGGLLYNYPAIWLDLRYLGVTSRSTYALGISFAIMTIASLLLLFEAKRMVTAIIIFLAATSQIVLLAIERGNMDQVIFSALIFGLFSFASSKPQTRLFLTGCLITFLTILKVYPIAAVVIFVRNRKALLTAAVAAVLSIGALFLVNGRTVLQALANTPQVINGSFGAYPFFFQITHHTTHSLAVFYDQHSHLLATAGALIMGGFAISAAALNRESFRRFVPPLNFDRSLGSIAVCCLAIYCFAFVAGASYDYRLIFLLGPLALLVDDLNTGTQRSFLAAILILGLLENTFFMREFLDGLVFLGASAWLGTSLLDHVRTTEVSTSAFPRTPAAAI